MKQDLKDVDIQLLKQEQKKLVDEQHQILSEKTRLRKEYNLPLFGFDKTEIGQKFQEQYGGRLSEIQKSLDEIKKPIQVYDNKVKQERKEKQLAEQSIEQKQELRKGLADQRYHIYQQRDAFVREEKSLRAEWEITESKLNLPLKELFKSKEWKEYEAKMDDMEVRRNEFFKETNPTLDRLNEEILKLDKEISESGNNKEYAEYRSKLDNSGLSEADFRRKEIIEASGTTKDPHLAGYIFPDGSMIKMGEEGFRGDDHRFVREYFAPGSKEYNDQETAMWSFIAEGNIRWKPEGPGISIDASQPITKEQKMALYDVIDYAKNRSNDFYVDVVSGDKIKSLQYERKQMSVAKIVKDFNDCREQVMEETKKEKAKNYERNER